MRIQVEEKEPCKVSVTYISDPEKVLAKRNEVTDLMLEEASKLILPGFRKGKAPVQAIKVRYHKNIEDQTRQRLLAVAEEEILFETKLKTMFSTQILRCNLQDSYFECELLFFKKPPVELKTYKGLKIKKPLSTKTKDELAEQILQELRIKYGDVLPFAEDDTVQLSDKITMDVKCLAEGKEIVELTKEGILYTVGQGFYHEFDDNVVGMKAGDEKIFEVLWDTQTKEKATFFVKVHAGVKIASVSIDDYFAQKLGIDNVDKLRAEIDITATKKIKDFEKGDVNNQIVSQLMTSHQIEVPSWLVSMDAQQLAIQHNLKWNEIDPASKTALESKALDRLKLTLIMDAIREVEPEVQFSNNEILDIVRGRVAQQGQDPDKFVVEMQRTGKLFGVIAALQQEATLEFLVKNMEIIIE